MPQRPEKDKETCFLSPRFLFLIPHEQYDGLGASKRSSPQTLTRLPLAADNILQQDAHIALTQLVELRPGIQGL